MTQGIDLSGLELPTRKHEAWKYTDLSRLIHQVANPLALPDTEAADWAAMLATALPLDAPRLVFADGLFRPELSNAEVVPQALEPAAAGDSNSPLASLGRLTAGGHYRLQLSGQSLPPLRLICLHSDATSVLSDQQLHIELDEHCSAELIEEHLGGCQGLATSRNKIQLANGSALRLIRIQHLAEQQFLLGENTAEIGADARLHEVHLEWGGRLSRLQADRHLLGAGARADYFALSGLTGRQQVDHQVLVRHASADATSRLRARGIVSGAARQVFNGKVLVERDAQRTDSDQLLRNLLLSDKAEVDAKPELEIYADDVRCAHGSTVGRLDELALFYLRSRGLAPDEARRLLMLSFAEEIFGQIADQGLHDAARDALTAHLSLMES